jgi:DNA mismatch repair ATPase MutS
VPETVCSAAAWSFARVEELWARFAPLTPYGKDAKERRELLSDRALLEHVYDRVEDAAAFLGGAEAGVADRVAYHLKRLPRLPFSRRDTDAPLDLELIELFQVKKFIANYRGILRALGEETRRRFGLEFHSEELAARLDSGGSDPETFFIADAYHPDLPGLRAAIDEKDSDLRRARAAAKARSRIERGLDFGERDFLVVPKDEAFALLAQGGEREDELSGGPRRGGPRYAVESYDGRSCVVRIQDDPETLALDEERSELVARERAVESHVLSALSEAVGREARALLDYADAIGEFDLARARAVLAAELDCRRPELGSGALVLERGRVTPCEADCLRMGLSYKPLDARVDEAAAVLFGSNMGGKTVALQTLMFFQAIAQAGLFAPAARFATSVYARLDYVGELRSAARGPGAAALRAGPGGEEADGADTQGGLSGFGFEIRSFAEAWEAARGEGAFVVLDEFARTTSSAEAEAILSAAVEALSALGASRCVLATHFRGISRARGVRYLEMRGLDREAAGEAMLSDEPIAGRIRRINRMMRYEIVEADELSGSSDAIAIASLLGLDPRIAERAAELYAARPRNGARGCST